MNESISEIIKDEGSWFFSETKEDWERGLKNLLESGGRSYTPPSPQIKEAWDVFWIRKGVGLVGE